MFAILWLTFYLSLSATAQANGGDLPPDDQPVGWQVGDNHRGTWEITSSCLSTIFACTWTVQHLNIPDKQDGKWSRWLRSLKWMIITILFPELIVLHAMFEFSMALQALRSMEKDEGKFVELPWWLHPGRSSSSLLQQLLYLLNRFLCWLSCSSKQQEASDTERQSVEDDPKWTLTHCFFANMGGFYCEEGQSRILLTAFQLAEEQQGFERPTIMEEDIEDKSKQDWFAKGFAALQFLQLALSLIMRTNRGLAFSQLETITLGFAVCGTAIYLAYLYKPQRVETRISLARRREPRQAKSLGPLRFKKTYDSFWDILMNGPSYNKRVYAKTDERAPKENPKQNPRRIPNDNIPISKNRFTHPGVFLLAFASGLFGALHAIAWHFEFPSTVEKILWQTATIVAAGSPVVGLLTIPFAQLTVSAGDSQLFMLNCLRLIREFSWHVSDKGPVEQAYEKLENILIMQDTTREEAKQQFASIFSPEQNLKQASHLGRELGKFLERTDNFTHLKAQPLDLHSVHSDKEFIEQFGRLVDLMERKGSKKLIDSARTNVFPQKNLLPEAFNRAILYVTTCLYCLSRLSLLAVAFSSLRRMPESVYVNTPWTAYIPTLGSSR